MVKKRLTNAQKRGLWSRAYSARHRLYYGTFKDGRPAKKEFVTKDGEWMSRAERTRRIAKLDKTLKKYRNWK